MRRILVVDDDPLIGHAMRIWLERHGYEVSTAISGGAFGDAETTGSDLLRLAARLGATRYLVALGAVAGAGALSEPQGSDGVARHEWKLKSETQGTRMNHASN
jgi:CheY-like chemotaxis protein